MAQKQVVSTPPYIQAMFAVLISSSEGLKVLLKWATQQKTQHHSLSVSSPQGALEPKPCLQMSTLHQVVKHTWAGRWLLVLKLSPEQFCV